MQSPHSDLLQRIHYRLERGDATNYERVMTDLRTGARDFELQFDFHGRPVYWTCFEAGRFSDVILEEDNYLYFYLSDATKQLEYVIPGHTFTEDLKKPLLERMPSLHYLWVLSPNFPGLEGVPKRPIKIHLQPIRRDHGPMSKLSHWLQKMLLQYEAGSKPIFEYIPPDDRGRSRKKIVEKSGRKL
jgi:hypothetical protein